MVKTAASAAFDDEAVQQEVLSIWRLTSGSVHGFAWSLLGQQDTHQVGQADRGGLAPFTAVGGLERIANRYLCAFLMARQGWSLLGKRNT